MLHFFEELGEFVDLLQVHLWGVLASELGHDEQTGNEDSVEGSRGAQTFANWYFRAHINLEGSAGGKGEPRFSDKDSYFELQFDALLVKASLFLLGIHELLKPFLSILFECTYVHFTR